MSAAFSLCVCVSRRSGNTYAFIDDDIPAA